MVAHVRDPFVDIVGQDAAVATLQRQLARTGGGGSTLLVGPDGVGRFLLAHAAAETILATTPEAGERARTGVHADLSVLEPTEGIAGVRKLRAALARQPVEGPRQVLIVRDADRLSHEAHNALLKTLEEPPADAAIFVLAAASELLPETVVSRCRVVRVPALAPPACAAVLQQAGVPAAEAATAAADAEGSPGAALRQRATEAGSAATALVEVLRAPAGDPFGAIDGLVKRRSGEDAGAQRQRLRDVLGIAAARLRRGLPTDGAALRSVLEALRSLERNASPGILLADLALLRWRERIAGTKRS